MTHSTNKLLFLAVLAGLFWLPPALAQQYNSDQPASPQSAAGEEAPLNLVEILEPGSKDSSDGPVYPRSDDRQIPAQPVLAEADNQTITDQQAAPSQQADPAIQPAIPASAPRIGRRPLSNVGLVSIGLPDARGAADPLSSLIWRGSSAEQIIALYRLAPHQGPSAALNDLVRAALLRQAVPPSGAADLSDQLIKARLNWLAAAGESTALADLVRKLPDDENWPDWQRWLVSYDLLRGQDQQACASVSRQSQATMEDFWHQSQIICHLLAGNNGAASFAADILRASGSQDIAFFQLTDQLLGRSDIVPDMADISGPLHLALMDAAHIPAGRTQLASLTAAFAEATQELGWLDRDAALEQASQRVRSGRLPAGEAIELLRSLYDPSVSLVMAISQLEAAREEAVDMASAGVLSQLAGALLDGTAGDEFDLFVQTVFAAQSEAGTISHWLPFYRWLIDQRLDADGLPDLDDQTKGLYGLITVLDEPNEPLLAALQTSDGFAEHSRALLNHGAGQPWPLAAVAGLNGWFMMPLLEMLDQTRPEADWFALAAGQRRAGRVPASLDEKPLSYPGMLALKQAQQAGLAGQTALLASWLLADHRLAESDSGQLAELVSALEQVGFGKTARALCQEALQAKILALYLSDNPLS